MQQVPCITVKAKFLKFISAIWSATYCPKFVGVQLQKSVAAEISETERRKNILQVARRQ